MTIVNQQADGSVISFEQDQIEIMHMQLGKPGGSFHNIQLVMKSGNSVVATFVDEKVMDDMFKGLINEKVSGMTSVGIPNKKAVNKKKQGSKNS